MAARTSAFSAALSTIEQAARALRVSESAKLVRLFPAPPGIQPKKLRAAQTPQTPLRAPVHKFVTELVVCNFRRRKPLEQYVSPHLDLKREHRVVRLHEASAKPE
jgi:hypothetical protein